MFYYLDKASAMRNIVKLLRKSEIKIDHMEAQFGSNVALEYEGTNIPQHITYESSTNTIREANPSEIAAREQLKLIAGLGMFSELWHKGNFNPDEKANVNHTHAAAEIITDSIRDFVSHSEKQVWNNKVNSNGTYMDLTVGDSYAVGGIQFHKEDKYHGIERVFGHVGDKNHAYMLDNAAMRRWLNVENGSTNYQHPSTHPADMIVEYSKKRFVTDDQINFWNAKSPAHGHPYLPLTGGTVNGDVLVNGKLKFASDCTYTSDARKKQDITLQDMSKDQLTKALNTIRSYRYRYKEDPSQETFCGFLAQEWESVFGSDCVEIAEDGTYQIRLVAILSKMWMILQECYRKMEGGCCHGKEKI